MQVHDYASGYQSKSDEELRLLALDREDLIPEARLALDGELSRRRIAVEGDRARNFDKNGTTSGSGPELVSPPLSAARFVGEVLDLYQSHFGFFFTLTLPAVAGSWILFYATSKEVNATIQQHSLGHRHIDPTTALEAFSLRGVQWLASWMIFSLLFAIICFATREIDSERSPNLSESLSGLRQRVGSFLGVSSLLLGITLVASFLAGLVGVATILIPRPLHFHAFPSLALLLLFAALLPVSRFGLAIPAVILDECRVFQSMFRSGKLTEGKWLVLAALLAKSLIGGYVVGMSPFWLASFVPLPFTRWFLWVLRALSIAAVSAVEPVMFIGFVLLYLRTARSSSPGLFGDAKTALEQPA